MAKNEDSKHHSNTASEPAAKCRGALAAAAADGASLSNTAPAKHITCQILRTGVDSLYLSYPGKLLPALEAQLESLKVAAQSDDSEIKTTASIVLSDHTLTVHGKGQGRFPFVLSNNWYRIQLSRERSEKMPMAYVQISSELLTRAGFEAAVRGINNLMSVMTENFEHPKVSRVDLCTDVIFGGNLKDIPWEHFVTRANKLNFRTEGHELTGVSIGEGGPLMCRIYNKTLEALIHNKDFFYPIWEQCGWLGEEVWRVEFQLKREVLRQLEIDSVGDLSKQLNSIWEYVSGKWLQIKFPTGEGRRVNTQRWTPYDFWEDIQAVSFTDDPVETITRVSKISSPSDEQLFVHGMGTISSFMAIRGIENVEDAWPVYIEEARKYHIRRHRKDGLALNSYLRQKVNQKRQKFAVRRPDQQHAITGKGEGDAK